MNKLVIAFALALAGCASATPETPKPVIPAQRPIMEGPQPVIPYPDRPQFVPPIEPPLAAPTRPVEQLPLDQPPAYQPPQNIEPPIPQAPELHLPFQYQSPIYNPPAVQPPQRMEVQQMDPAQQIMLMMVSVLTEVAMRSSDPGYVINHPRRISPGYHARFHY